MIIVRIMFLDFYIYVKFQNDNRAIVIRQRPLVLNSEVSAEQKYESPERRSWRFIFETRQKENVSESEILGRQT